MAPRSFTQLVKLLAIAATQIPFSHSFIQNDTLTGVSLNNGSSLGLEGLLNQAPTDKPGQDDHTCGPDHPCKNKACCGKSGWCGYTPAFCGTGCQSNCDAKAECGEYASFKGKTCPLNVCCSQYGFCGTSTEFCATGCQSNCDQPKPSGGSGTDARSRVIGYWETWNSQHPCGRMGLNEIPVESLTHLNVAFGYISEDLRVTNMDGISEELYRNMGNVKARNPDLKISIALGGWTFNDPGPWQNRFSQVVKTHDSRAKFIQNLLGFLSQYGYDGVDWEYPGADDRGGTDGDPIKYVALLKELRAAISASGQSYIVTFTAPSSYWYLRHFRVKEMEAQVDWINLMSYDIHGVWDGNNPIGNHILSHTNLTEIDLALNLFWRVGVKPSSIVLGLGFYGRSFTLSDSGCWKPGCEFSGPGEAGECTGTPGILSYREIQRTLQKTGATAYLDADAAAKYVVYDKNSWISFDDAETFKLKIQYANRLGLSGLMIWAIDLDDGDLSAIQAVSGVTNSNVDRKFNLADLAHLFPKEMLPPPDADINYGLMTFGGSRQDGYSNPRGAAFGFVLVAGEKHVVSSLKKREGHPEPLTFLDCPADIDSTPSNHTHTARVVCLNDDIKGCFQLAEGGIEGTVIQMPDECARGSLGRAISMETSNDQSIPADILTGKQATSQVFNLIFDFDVMLMRRDSEKTKMRIDFSNAPDYWESIVDSPGIQSRDLHPRFFAPDSVQWKNRYTGSKVSYNSDYTIELKKSVDVPLIWHTAKDCTTAASDGLIEGFLAYVSGTLDVTLTYGFSAIINIGHGWDVKEAAGFVRPIGQTDLTYGVSGVADIDIEKAGMGNPATKIGNKNYFDTHQVTDKHTGYLNRITFSPYYRMAYTMATFNFSADNSALSNGPTAFDGFMSSRMVTKYGETTSYFPPLNNSLGEEVSRNLSQISTSKKNVLYSAPEHGGKIILQTILEFGVDISIAEYLTVQSEPQAIQTLSGEMSVGHVALSEFRYFPGGLAHRNKSCIDYSWGEQMWQMANESDDLGWKDGGLYKFWHHEASPCRTPEGEEVCYDEPDDSKQGYMPGWDYGSGLSIDPGTFIPAKDADTSPKPNVFIDSEINCNQCISCNSADDLTKKRKRTTCCGCVNMDLRYGYNDIGECYSCEENFDPTDRIYPGDLSQLAARKDGIATMSEKSVKICGKDHQTLPSPYLYPAFPKAALNRWDGIQNGKWDSIGRYWGNKSQNCDDWSTIDLQPADLRDVGGKLARAKYNTEHVFEAQLISDFFTQWLDKGEIINASPPITNPVQKLECSHITTYMRRILSPSPWQIRRPRSGYRPASFIQLVTSELGNQAHLDRLTVFLARPNRMKGAMFSGNRAVAKDTYLGMDVEEQLLAVKEMGMVFTYMNDPKVWDAFCLTYEAIYSHMGDYNEWWEKNQQTSNGKIPDLQKLWKEFVQLTLKSFASRAQEQFLWAYTNRAADGGQSPYKGYWSKNYNYNKHLLELPRGCPHL